MKAVVVVVLAAAVLQAAQADRAQVRISGGGVRQNGDLKFIVDVIETTYGQFPTHKGAGVLLNPNWVITTKVALTPEWGIGKGFHVEVGKSKGGDGTKVDIAKQVDSADGVLTLVQLKIAVPYDELSRPANLPFPDVNNADVDALLVGWGDKKLRAAPVHVLSQEDCKQALNLDPKADVPLCTTDDKAATCDSDDGSPLVQDLKGGVYKLLGLAIGTKGAKCPPAAGTVSKYADVAKYAQWIVNTVMATS